MISWQLAWGEAARFSCGQKPASKYPAGSAKNHPDNAEKMGTKCLPWMWFMGKKIPGKPKFTELNLDGTERESAARQAINGAATETLLWL